MLSLNSLSGRATVQVLIVESKMGYLHKFSIRGNDIAARQTLAVVEKPHCIAVDDQGVLFVQVRVTCRHSCVDAVVLPLQDLIAGKVHQINAHMEVEKDVCLVDDSVFSITANHGYLGVAVRQVRSTRGCNICVDANIMHEPAGAHSENLPLLGAVHQGRRLHERRWQRWCGAARSTYVKNLNFPFFKFFQRAQNFF